VRGAAVLGALERAGGPGTMTAPKTAAKKGAFPDLSGQEIAVLTPLIVLILVLGFFPGPVLDVINPTVTATMNEMDLADPVGGPR
jgi:NADH-quinone oxidoreductase subunit M